MHIAITENDLFSTLVLTITDDGIGLTAKHQPGVGATSMRERVEEVGGTYQMSSTPRGGTRITAVLPFAVGVEL